MIRTVTRAGANASAFPVLYNPRLGQEIAHPAGMLRDRRKVPPCNKKNGNAIIPRYKTDPINPPTNAQPRLTRSLFSHFQPRICTVGVPQVCRGCFSVSLLHCGQ